ncbi:hypothetical protein Scep_004236 [Stephania cephalantha]|uniref:Uncharacterized protein n=1 Tax=Stephania cephalantha TaxID=152367 RepID=A0AAP0KS28_9MAGN
MRRSVDRDAGKVARTAARCVQGATPRGATARRGDDIVAAWRGRWSWHGGAKADDATPAMAAIGSSRLVARRRRLSAMPGSGGDRQRCGADNGRHAAAASARDRYAGCGNDA